MQEVVTTLRTAAATEPEALETGRLTEGREASGFDALAGAAPKRELQRAAVAAAREAERARVAHERAETRVSAAQAELDAARGAGR